MINRLSLLIIVLLFPLFAMAGKNPADYPLKVHILEQGWRTHTMRPPGFSGVGRGNIEEGESVHGFDFSYSCSFALRFTPASQFYLAKWKKPQLTMLLLASEIGKNEKYDECEMKTTVLEGVYFRTSEGLNEITQEDYKKRKAARDAKAEQKDGAAPAARSKISIISAPDNAEIEIDGEFAGNTPSVLELDPGEHSITVRKAGYKPWEKKLRLMPGEIKLNAALEAAGTS